MSRNLEHPIPQEFSVLYSPGLITNIARKTLETINDASGTDPDIRPLTVIGLGEQKLDGKLLKFSTTKLFVNRATTSINSTLLLGDISNRKDRGYFSKDQVKKVQEKLRGRDIDSTLLNIRARNVLFIPRISEFAYVEIDMGYPSHQALLEFLESGERLTKAEKNRRNMVCRGEQKNPGINIRLSVDNEWITNLHSGPVVFEFYFKRYEAFLKSLYQSEGYPLPEDPIMIKPTKDLV